MPALQLSPEQQARVPIDRMLEDAGWVVLDYGDADFAAGPGVAIREFMTPKCPMDYLLVAERKVVGSIEAKREGETLRQAEEQADRCRRPRRPAHRGRLRAPASKRAAWIASMGRVQGRALAEATRGASRSPKQH